MIQKDHQNEKLKFYEEKIKSLYKTFQTLNPSASARLDFPLDPAEQSEFRRNFLKKVLETPSLPQLKLYSTSLIEEFSINVLTPHNLLNFIKDFFKKRVQMLSFSKYKLLLKPHIAKNSVSAAHLEFELGEVNSELGKLDELLKILAAMPGALQFPHIMLFFNYEVEKFLVGKVFEKYFAQTKWMFITQKYEIWKKFAENLKIFKEKSVGRMKALTSDPNIGKFKSKVKIITNINAKNLARQQEIMKKVHAHHSVFAEEHLNINEELLNSHYSEIDMPPVLISSVVQLNTQLEIMAHEFSLISNLSDAGHTITDQISHIFPQLFEVQSHKLEWIAYGDSQSKEKARKALLNLPQKIISKISTVRKLSSVGSAEESTKIICKLICIKDSDWVKENTIQVNAAYWEKQQEARLENIAKFDSLLENSFASVNIQNFNVIVKLLEEFAETYSEKSSKKGVLRGDLAENSEELKKKYFANLLTDRTQSQLTEGEQVQLNSGNIKSLYTLRLLKCRELKFRLLGVLNVLRSVEKRLNLEVADIPLILKADFKNISAAKQSDQIEVIEGEYYVRDPSGEWVIYNIVFEDYNEIIQKLIRIGSFYIEKHEVLSNHTNLQYPPIDREVLLGELLEEETKFQENKLGLVMALLKVYEKLTEVQGMQELAEYIVKVIKAKPRLNLCNSYFTQSYWAHTQSLSTQSLLIRQVYSYHKLQQNDIKYPLSRFLSWAQLVEGCVEELILECQLTCTKEISALECAVWTVALSNWNSLILKDNDYDIVKWRQCPEIFTNTYSEIIKGHIRNSDNSLISEEQFFTNITNFVRLCHEIYSKNNEVQILMNLLQSQKKIRKNSEIFSQSASVRDFFPYSIYDFDMNLFAILNFFKVENVKHGVLDTEILISGAIYEVFNKQLLEITVRLNHLTMDRWLRQIAEIELAKEKFYITKNSKINWMNVLGRKGEGIISSKVDSEVKKLVNEMNANTQFYDVVEWKDTGKACALQEILEKGDRLLHEILENYCKFILDKVYPQCTSLQVFKILAELQKLLKFVPEKPLLDFFGSFRPSKSKSFSLSQFFDLETQLKQKLFSGQDLEIDLILHQLTGLLRFTQINLYISCLQLPSTSLLDLHDIPSLEFHRNEEEDLSENALNFYMTLENMKIVLESLSKIANTQTKDWETEAEKSFSYLAISFYALLDKTLTESLAKEINSLDDLTTSLFRYHGNQKKAIKPDIISICEQFFIHEPSKEKNPASFPKGTIEELTWGLINCLAESRNFAWKSAKISKNSENILKLHRLKTIFLSYTASQSGYSLQYSDCQSVLSSYINSPNESNLSQIKILRDYFEGELCNYGVSQILTEIKCESSANLRGLHEFSCNFDGNYKDSTSKIGAMQSFFNCMRNKCSRVDTPTAGCGLVAFVKDITACAREFSENMMEFNEEHHCFQREVLNLQAELLEKQGDFTEKEGIWNKKHGETVRENFEATVNAHVTQKGSEIIYNLDTAHRQLREIKENTKLLEKYTRILVNNEFKERIETKNREIRDLELNYKSFQAELAQNIHNQLESNITAGILTVMPYSSKQKRVKVEEILNTTNSATKSRNSFEKKRIGNIILQLRVFHQWSLIKNKQKIDKEVSSLKGQLKSNQFIWEELNHTQRRETILKQELAYSQSTLASSEKLVEKMQQDIEEINTKKLQLQLYRENKGKHIQQLEFLTKSSKSSKETQANLADYRLQKEKVKNLQSSEIKAGEEYLKSHKAYREQIKNLKKTLESLRGQKSEIFSQLSLIRSEMDSHVNEEDWKGKYLKLERTLTQSTSKTLNLGSKSPSDRRHPHYFPQIHSKHSILS